MTLEMGQIRWMIKIPHAFHALNRRGYGTKELNQCTVRTLSANGMRLDPDAATTLNLLLNPIIITSRPAIMCVCPPCL
jgi:hypothetical protein